MTKMTRLIVLPLLLGSALAWCGATTIQAGTQVTLYVSPTGSDSNNGSTPISAFATLSKARDAVRAINANMTGDIVVEIAKGDYPVTETVTFTEQDSGNNGFNVVYKNQDGIGSARFIGGTKVTGWTTYKDNIYQANVGTGPGFTTLYENGIRADMARWPKRTSPFATSRGGYLVFTDKKGEDLTYQDNALSPDGTAFDPTGKDFGNAWVYAWNGGDGHRWCSANTAVTAVSNGVISIKPCSLGWPPDSFIIEGSLGLLTQPGEFFYDKTAGTLYYSSRFPGPIEQQEIIAPQLVRLIDVTGSSDSTPAHNIQFSGLTFTGTDRIPQSGEDDWSDAQQSAWDAAIYLKNATNITVEKCRVSDTGISAITLEGSQSCTITGCLVEHTGYHGISLINGSNHTVSNCLIRYIGELRGHGDGVSVMYDNKRPHGDGTDSTAMGCKDTLTNLEVYYVARAGIAIRGSGDQIQYVKVHDCVQDSGDQGAFYLVDPAINATLNQCTSFHNYCDLSNMDRPPTAVYNDRDATNTVWSNIEAGDSQMFVFRHDPQKEGTLTFENVSWDPKCNPRSNEVAGPVNPDFDKSKMEYDKIGITADFPAEYNDLAAAPVAPLNLWTQTENAQVTLHWTEVDRAASYNIKRAATPGGPYTSVGASTVPATGWDLGTSYTDATVSNGHTYYYVVTAVNKTGESPASVELKATPDQNGSAKLTGTTIGSGGDTAKAFDGDLKSYFETPNGWAGLDLGSPFVITKIRYSPRSDNTDTTSKMCNGEFQGADNADFSNPVTLFKVIASKGGAGTPVLIPQAIFNPKPFQYVRFTGPNGNTTVAEIEFYGHPAAP
jgi:parallel beta-helix repeat protein